MRANKLDTEEAWLKYAGNILRDLEKYTSFHLGRIKQGGIEAESAKESLALQVDVMRACYKVTKNPTFVWRALLVCKDAGLDMQQWIVNYLYEAGSEIVNAAYKNDRPAEKVLIDALSFDGKGQGGVFGQFKTAIDHMGAVAEVVRACEKDEVRDISSAEHEAAKSIIASAVGRINAEMEKAIKPQLKIKNGEYEWKSGPITRSLAEGLVDRHFHFLRQSQKFNKKRSSIVEELQKNKKLSPENFEDLESSFERILRNWRIEVQSVGKHMTA